MNLMASVGLAVIPFLPTLFDEPVEHLVNQAFDHLEKRWLGGVVPSRSEGHGSVNSKTEL